MTHPELTRDTALGEKWQSMDIVKKFMLSEYLVTVVGITGFLKEEMGRQITREWRWLDLAELLALNDQLSAAVGITDSFKEALKEKIAKECE